MNDTEIEKDKESETIKGFVVKAVSGFFSAETADGIIVAKIPKRLVRKKKERQRREEELTSSLVAVGDTVNISIAEDGTAQIESVEPRKSVLSRARPAANARLLSSEREQVLIANPDQAVLVFSITRPDPSLRKLDRFLVVTERNDLPTIIAVNKIDLTDINHAKTVFGLYESLGYRTIYTSSYTGEGVEELREALRGKISILTGSSGVGKSSLLNAIESNLGLKVGAVSEATTKGMHTTRHTELIPLQLEGGGYVADTPGIRGLALFDLEPDELDAYFVEIAPLVPDCRFSDCKHINEIGCAVLQAVKDGTVSPERHDSYLRLREEQEELQQTAY